MPDSTHSNSIETAGDDTTASQREPVYEILEECYGMKKGFRGTAKAIHRNGVLPEFLIQRKLAKQLKD